MEVRRTPGRGDAVADGISYDQKTRMQTGCWMSRCPGYRLDAMEDAAAGKAEAEAAVSAGHEKNGVPEGSSVRDACIKSGGALLSHLVGQYHRRVRA